MKKYLPAWMSLLLLAACNMPQPNAAPDLFATMQASTPAQSGATIAPAETPAPFPTSMTEEPQGKIVLTCQTVTKDTTTEQICIVNADGSGYRQLTHDKETRHFYPSLAPDGNSVVYSAYNKDTKHFEIYEMNLVKNETRQLTFAFGDLNAPEISPDGSAIAFTRFYLDPEKPTTWLMNRQGENLRQVADIRAWDPTWSPDGSAILFASYINNLSQLFIINVDGTNFHQVGNFPALRGRSDWSPQNLIVTYSGKPWQRELYLMSADGSGGRQISPAGGNAQGPSFSPDGNWIAFTAYYDKYDVHGCEIYIIRVDGSDLRRLTQNDYCDYQPRWGQ